MSSWFGPFCMPWSIFSLVWVLASITLDGGQAGGNTGLYSAIITMFVAIVLVGGSLMVYLIRVARRESGETHHEERPLS